MLAARHPHPEERGFLTDMSKILNNKRPQHHLCIVCHPHVVIVMPVLHSEIETSPCRKCSTRDDARCTRIHSICQAATLHSLHTNTAFLCASQHKMGDYCGFGCLIAECNELAEVRRLQLLPTPYAELTKQTHRKPEHPPEWSRQAAPGCFLKAAAGTPAHCSQRRIGTGRPHRQPCSPWSRLLWGPGLQANTSPITSLQAHLTFLLLLLLLFAFFVLWDPTGGPTGLA